MSKPLPPALLLPAALGALLTAATPASAPAQPRLGSLGTTITASPAFESWSFANGGLPQPTSDHSATVMLSRVTQLSVPVVLAIPFGRDRWTLDVASAFASGKVTLESQDPSLQESSYTVDGITDTKIRLTGKLAGENIVLTLGVNAPTGKTELSVSELSALRVIAAPALGFQIPILGTGGGGTAGIIFASRAGGWAWAAGASYELRPDYAPIALAAGIPAPDFNPGDVVHVSLGADGIVGAGNMSIGVSADFFSEDELQSGGSSPIASQLGPIFTAEWRMSFAASGMEELTLALVDRYRTKYKQAGSTVDGSDGNYLEASLLGAHRAGSRTGFAWELSGRHHTGLKADSSIATAAAAGAGLRLSLSHELGGGALLQPYARAQYLQLKNGGASVSATGFSAGLTIQRIW